MSVVAHSFSGLGKFIVTSGTRIDPPCLKLSFLRRPVTPSKFLSTSSSQRSKSCGFAVSCAEGGSSSHEIHQLQSQSVESACSAAIQPWADANCSERRWGCLETISFTEHGRVEVLALGLLAGAVLLPEQSWAVDMETVVSTPTTEGFMAWAANEPANALSLPTWIIHIASVAEWVTAMALVWEYGNTPGKSSWKGLTWGMVPLLGGAMCACTWHFFYNAPSLEVLVVLQAFLTVVGNFTMWIAAYRVWKISQEEPSIK